MSNATLANEISQFISDKLQEREGKVREDFITVSDIKVSPDGLIHNDTPFSKTVQNKILASLALRPKFLSYGEKMSESDWNMVLSKLKDAYGTGGFYATAITTDNHSQYELVYKQQQDKKRDDSGLSVSNIGNLMGDALAITDESFDKGQFSYDILKNKFNIEILSAGEVFNPIASDPWRKGHFFSFNDRAFTRMPMFERLICSNGMTTREKRFNASIQQSKFNNDRIAKEINKGILMATDEIESMISMHVQRLKNTNVSVQEFLRMKKYLMKLNEEQHENVAKLFDERPIFAAYKKSPEEMPVQWRKSADSGLNGYNFLNLVTWIGSHDDVTQFTASEKKDIQIAASNFLFAKEHDLENLAEKVKIEYPVSEIMA
jgi:hypothetical protein